MAAPPLSVVLPVRDGGVFFAEALASIENQTFGDYELLIQDDGSTDGSLDLAQVWAARDERVRVESGAPSGVAHAANRAAERARAPLILRMDADDVARPDRFEQQVAFASAYPEVGLFGSRVRYFPREVLGEGMVHYETWINALVTHEQIMRDRFVEYPLPHPSTVVRADVFRAVGGFRDGNFPEDYDFFLRAAAAGVVFGKHPDVLLDWRHGEHRTTGRDPRYGLDRFRALKVQHLVPLLEAGGRPIAIVGAGPDGKRLARGLIDAGLEIAWFLEVHPGRIGNEIHGARVIAYSDLERARGALFLLAVGQKGRRAAVRALLADAGIPEASQLCVQ